MRQAPDDYRGAARWPTASRGRPEGLPSSRHRMALRRPCWCRLSPRPSRPIVALVQEVERSQFDRNAFQELDHVALFSSCSKWVRRIITPDRVDDYIDAAFVAAGSGRPGPAVLLLPADLLRETAVPPARTRRSNLGAWPIDRTRPADAKIQ